MRCEQSFVAMHEWNKNIAHALWCQITNNTPLIVLDGHVSVAHRLNHPTDSVSHTILFGLKIEL